MIRFSWYPRLHRRLDNVFKTVNSCCDVAPPTQALKRWLLFFGSSRPEVFCKKGVLIAFTKFTGKHLCQSYFINKVAGLSEACNFIKKETLAQVFSCEFCEISKNTFFIEHLWWLLLSYYNKRDNWLWNVGN